MTYLGQQVVHARQDDEPGLALRLQLLRLGDDHVLKPLGLFLSVSSFSIRWGMCKPPEATPRGDTHRKLLRVGDAAEDAHVVDRALAVRGWRQSYIQEIKRAELSPQKHNQRTAFSWAVDL